MPFMWHKPSLRPQQIVQLTKAHDAMMHWRAVAKRGDRCDRDAFYRHTDRFFALVEVYINPIAPDQLDYSARNLRRRPREDA